MTIFYFHCLIFLDCITIATIPGINEIIIKIVCYIKLYVQTEFIITRYMYIIYIIQLIPTTAMRGAVRYVEYMWMFSTSRVILYDVAISYS